MTTFESSIRQIPFPQQNVYDKLSDLNNLQKLKERYELMKDNMPEEARKQAACGKSRRTQVHQV